MDLRKISALLMCGMLLTGCGQTSQVPEYDNSSAVSAEVTEAASEETEPVKTKPSEEDTTVAASSKKEKKKKKTSATEAATEARTEAPTAAAVISGGNNKTASADTSSDDNTDYDDTGYHYSDSSGNNGNSSNSTDNSDYDQTEYVYRTNAASNRNTAQNTYSTTPVKPTATTIAFPKDADPDEMLDFLSLEQKVYQMFIVTPEQLGGSRCSTEARSELSAALKKYPVGGIIYFAQNLTSQSQTRNMISRTQEYAKSDCGVGMFIAVDEEGGLVARCAKKLGTTAFSNMAVYGKDNDGDTAYYIGQTLGNDLSSLGFNVDFAPVADVNINPGNELGSRIFSSDPEVVANMVSRVTEGLQDAGVCATLKHFPGLGAESGNTHTDSFVVIDRTIDQLRESEFVPFGAAIDAGADFVMVGHQITSGFGDDLPADLSYTAVTEMLRGELGFDGIAVTDSQMMNTIANVYGSGTAAVMSVKAGMDVILMPADIEEAANAICNAVRSGEISEERINESVYRILRQKYELGLF
ncbi:MAG: glycoside hydrolase family 3 [Ruminococcus sp.]|nr:glycoside hydrolase family 3 [Ruminococcus sp.]